MASDRTASDPRSVIVGATFRVTAIEGVPALATPTAELTFDAENRLTGRATVNRIMGPYTLDGDALSFGPLAGTMMAGPEEAMDQERRLHQALARCARVQVRDDGVVLSDADGVELAALVPADVEL